MYCFPNIICTKVFTQNAVRMKTVTEICFFFFFFFFKQNGECSCAKCSALHVITFVVTITLVNVYVDLVVFSRIADTSYTGSGRYWC